MLAERQIADHDRLEAGVAHQARGQRDRLGVVARHRHAGPLAVLVLCDVRQPRVADGVERAHDKRAGQQLGRGEAGALLARPGRDLAVAVHEGIAGVDQRLALELVRQILAQLRQRAVGHRHQHDLAEGGGFLGRSRARLAAQARRQRAVVFEVARREHDLVSRLEPDLAQGAADAARADDADLQSSVRAVRDSRGKGQGAQGEAGRRGAECLKEDAPRGAMCIV